MATVISTYFLRAGEKNPDLGHYFNVWNSLNNRNLNEVRGYSYFLPRKLQSLSSNDTYSWEQKDLYKTFALLALLKNDGKDNNAEIASVYLPFNHHYTLPELAEFGESAPKKFSEIFTEIANKDFKESVEVIKQKYPQFKVAT